MNSNECVAFLDDEPLSDQDARDLRLAKMIGDAFWAAVEVDPIWGSKEDTVVGCCILAATTVRDALHLLGRADAKIARTGLEVRREMAFTVQSLCIGTPQAPKLPNAINAHMTIRIGNVWLDPTHGQTKRPWNNSPRAAAFLTRLAPGETLDLGDGHHANILNWHAYRDEGVRHRIAYFKLTRAVDLATRAWRYAPDASPARRALLVENTCRFYAEATAGDAEALAMKNAPSTGPMIAA
ncbi:hypothetical protein [Pararhizobium arenae]|uniref:hypothetical protein n=1 Tax=Pararhizobium arenae TaxID=1856850 RepID=UPI00094AF540|nr:hypothetical protein [Pararhizobium arenae]